MFASTFYSGYGKSLKGRFCPEVNVETSWSIISFVIRRTRVESQLLYSYRIRKHGRSSEEVYTKPKGEMMQVAYKYRIYPNQTQKLLLAKTFGCVRFVYNHFLAMKIDAYKTEKRNINYSECSRILTSMKNDPDTAWLKEPDKCALQNALKNLDTAYKNFFKHGFGFPKFKYKKTHRYSYRTSNTISKQGKGSIEFNGKKIKLPKLGWVKCRDKQIPFGKIINATISQTPSGKYYCSLVVEEDVRSNVPNTDLTIGLDVGIKEFCILSNGEHVDNPKYLSKSLKRLAFLQRGLSRKTTGSANWQKQRIKVAKQYEKIANQRKDFLQKLTIELIRKYSVICIEDLDIKDMVENKDLSRSISDVSWGEFFRMLSYKADWYNRQVVKIDRYFPSSQTCHVCGYVNTETKNLSVREWICPQCHSIHDRDVNAAINIQQQGLQMVSI